MKPFRRKGYEALVQRLLASGTHPLFQKEKKTRWVQPRYFMKTRAYLKRLMTWWEEVFD